MSHFPFLDQKSLGSFGLVEICEPLRCIHYGQVSTQPISILNSVIAKSGDCVRYKCPEVLIGFVHRSQNALSGVSVVFSILGSPLPDRFEMIVFKK